MGPTRRSYRGLAVVGAEATGWPAALPTSWKRRISRTTPIGSAMVAMRNVPKRHPACVDRIRESRPGGRRTWMCAVFRPSQDGESENPRAVQPADALLTSNRHFFGDFLCASKESYPPLRGGSSASTRKAGKKSHWIPAFAGMTSKARRAGSDQPPAEPRYSSGNNSIAITIASSRPSFAG